MRASFIREEQNFERGLDPKSSMNIGNKIAQLIKTEEVSRILNSQKEGMYCLYDWENDLNSMRFTSNPKWLIKEYYSALEDIATNYLDENFFSKHIAILKINEGLVSGVFIDEKSMEAFDGVEILFSISFESNGKIYFGDE